MKQAISLTTRSTLALSGVMLIPVTLVVKESRQRNTKSVPTPSQDYYIDQIIVIALKLVILF